MQNFFRILSWGLSNPWVIFGLLAQFIFFMRFFVQWLASERRGEVVVPMAFWYLSIVGGVMLLVYAIHRSDVVFIAGQAGGLLMYLRNLTLAMRNSGGKVKEPGKTNLPI